MSFNLPRNYVTLTGILALTAIGIIGWIYSDADTTIIGAVIAGIVSLASMHQAHKPTPTTTP